MKPIFRLTLTFEAAEGPGLDIASSGGAILELIAGLTQATQMAKEMKKKEDKPAEK